MGFEGRDMFQGTEARPCIRTVGVCCCRMREWSKNSQYDSCIMVAESGLISLQRRIQKRTQSRTHYFSSVILRFKHPRAGP